MSRKGNCCLEIFISKYVLGLTDHSLTTFLKTDNVREQFEKEEIELLLEKIQVKEIRDLIVLSTITGMRIHELVNLKVYNILKMKDNYIIDIQKSKTDNGIRKIPIHKRFKYLIKNLIENKKEDDYIFYNELDGDREDKIEKRTMYQIRKYIKNKNKVFHSLRKNFTQQLYKSNIEELYIKLLLGHSLTDNLSFNTYNLSKVENEILLEEINKVNFKYLFENTEYDLSNIEEENNNSSIVGMIKDNNVDLNV